MDTSMKLFPALLLLLIVIAAGGGVFLYSGVYEIGADVPHTRLGFWVMETFRDHAIAAHAVDVQVPPLDDPALIAEGAEHYSGMCTGCHLAPGMDDSEIRPGLYPQPPKLAEPSDLSAAEKFWVIKHGVKMSAMPAWGLTHDDQAIWGMVAFLQKLPSLTPAQYAAMTGAGGDTPAGDGHEHVHSHGDAADSMPGMDMKADGHSHAGHDHGDKTASMPGMDMKSDKGNAGAMSGMDMPSKKGGASADTPEAAVDGFLKALAAGDAKTAEHWLASDVLIYESGGVESSRDEYVAHHMQADMEFLAKAKTERLENAANGGPWISWVTSRSRVSGKSDGKAVDLFSTETMVLKREDQGWRIAHIHWSSQRAGQ
jgi:ketosteroid isomerase-like protein/mono/diheme cytochrome c family protein